MRSLREVLRTVRVQQHCTDRGGEFLPSLTIQHVLAGDEAERLSRVPRGDNRETGRDSLRDFEGRSGVRRRQVGQCEYCGAIEQRSNALDGPKVAHRPVAPPSNERRGKVASRQRHESFRHSHDHSRQNFLDETHSRGSVRRITEASKQEDLRRPGFASTGLGRHWDAVRHQHRSPATRELGRLTSARDPKLVRIRHQPLQPMRGKEPRRSTR